MEILAQILGILAVVTFLLSFQFKKRRNIITVNVISRCLYITQYILLGAFEGAVLDFSGAVSSVIASHKEKSFIKKHLKLIIVLINIVIVGAGIALYENIYSIFAIVGIVLEVGALWITEEKKIRRLSFWAAPFWFVYNFMNRAYGSALGCVLVMISIIIATLRYDVKRQKTDK